MNFLRQAATSRGSGFRVVGDVDYRLARNMVVTEYRKGHLSRLDVCDAHPELLRAAADAGTELDEECPICEESKVRLVSYVFGPRLPASGRCVANKKELAKLSALGKDLACYVIEVCAACSWNHLAQAFSLAPKPSAATAGAKAPRTGRPVAGEASSPEPPSTAGR